MATSVKKQRHHKKHRVHQRYKAGRRLRKTEVGMEKRLSLRRFANKRFGRRPNWGVGGRFYDRF